MLFLHFLRACSEKKNVFIFLNSFDGLRFLSCFRVFLHFLSAFLRWLPKTGDLRFKYGVIGVMSKTTYVEWAYHKHVKEYEKKLEMQKY